MRVIEEEKQEKGKRKKLRIGNKIAWGWGSWSGSRQKRSRT